MTNLICTRRARLRRAAAVWLTIVLVFCLLPSSAAFALEVSAVHAVAIDAASGTVLFEKDARTKAGMASTTKIMTALVALEKCKLDEVVKASKHAVGTEGTSMYLSEGEEQTMENMLYGLMLNSGNDAAVAIAEHISGSEAEFAKLMTARAHELGAKDTSFANPHGLYHPQHYTTAYDLAQITRQAMKIPKFAEIVKTPSKVVPWPGHAWGKTLNNQNKLLRMYDGCDGVKTGFTPETGRTLVSSASRDGWRVITVTLNDRDDWADHTKMFDYAFNTYDFKTISQTGAAVEAVKVERGVNTSVDAMADCCFGVPYPKGTTPRIELKKELPKSVKAPVKQGQRLGEIIVTVDGKEAARVNLLAAGNVQQKPSGNLFSMFWGWVFGLIGLI